MDAAGKLSVGDGTGALTVDGTVATTQTGTNPVNFFHQSAFAVESGSGCVPIATPPAGKALVIREVRVNVFEDPSPGEAQNVLVFNSLDCSSAVVGDVNPPTVGQFVVPFDPGLGVPAGSRLSVKVNGGVQAETYVDGYIVGASQVPSSNVAQTSTARQR